MLEKHGKNKLQLFIEKYSYTIKISQTQLKEDISMIKISTNVFVFADKTIKVYQVTPQKYKKLMKENITKAYKKSLVRLEKAINLEAKQIARINIDIDTRVKCLAKNTSLHKFKRP